MLSADNWAERQLQALQTPSPSSDKLYRFQTSCVAAAAADIEAMTDDDVQVEVTYTEMAKHCDLRSFESTFGYGPDIGLELKDDTMVSYWKSTYQGRPCYFLDHSRIEYIWVKTDG
jgi:hypothetical protein